MLRPNGYTIVVDPDRPRPVEHDTVACCHCGAHIFTKPGSASTVYLIFTPAIWQWTEEPGASCFCCMKPVCLPCHDLGTCRPLERWLEQKEHGRGA